MNEDSLDQRVGLVERELVSQGGRLGRVEIDVAKVVVGIDKLLDRDARRPEYSARTVLAALGCVAALAAFTWWMIEHAPSVLDHERRLTRIDDKEDGRLKRLEGRLDKLDGWTTTTVTGTRR